LLYCVLSFFSFPMRFSLFEDVDPFSSEPIRSFVVCYRTRKSWSLHIHLPSRQSCTFETNSRFNLFFFLVSTDTRHNRH
jgi:hypothetical protein